MDFPYSSVPWTYACLFPVVGFTSATVGTDCAQVHCKSECSGNYVCCWLSDIQKQRPSKESLSKVIIYSILNKNTYYRLNRMSAVAPFSS